MKTEIPLKQWRIEEARRCGVTEGAIQKRLYGPWKKPQNVQLRRVNQRVVFVVKTIAFAFLLACASVHAESKLAIKPLDDGRIQIFVVSTVPWVLEWSNDGRNWWQLKSSAAAAWNGTQQFTGERIKTGFYRLKPWYSERNGAVL